MENFITIPSWCKVGIEAINVVTGQIIELKSIDTTTGDCLKFAHKGKPLKKFSWDIDSFKRAVLQGYMIVRGYTPPMLAKGFRYSYFSFDENTVKYNDQPMQSGTNKALKQCYEAIKKDWQ